MNVTRTRLTRRLDVQALQEGEAAVRDCRIVLAHCVSASDWDALTTVKHHRYGPMSYETHVFYYLKPWVRPFCAALLEAAKA